MSRQTQSVKVFLINNTIIKAESSIMKYYNEICCINIKIVLEVGCGLWQIQCPAGVSNAVCQMQSSS